MSNSDNIEAAPVDVKAAKKARRAAENKIRCAEWRLEKRRSLPPTPEIVAETLALCLFDLTTLPPSKRDARNVVIADVMAQAHRTMTIMGHPDVGRSMMALVESLRERLRTERFHHPVVHMSSKSTPLDTRVTPTFRGANHEVGIANTAQDTNRERAA